MYIYLRSNLASSLRLTLGLIAIFYNPISLAYEVDGFEPNRTLMLWSENFVVPLFLPSSCTVYRSATEYNS